MRNKRPRKKERKRSREKLSISFKVTRHYNIAAVLYIHVCTILEFQSRSLVPERARCHLATAETEYLVPLIKKYGTDYKVMRGCGLL